METLYKAACGYCGYKELAKTLADAMRLREEHKALCGFQIAATLARREN